MNKTFLKTMIVMLISIITFSCKKDTHNVYFNGGNSPVMSSDNSGVISISKLTKANAAITLSWTNPGYTFNTGASSQDVIYAIEVKLHDSATYSVLASVTKDLKTTITQEALSTMLTKAIIDGGLGATPEADVKIDLRIRAYLGILSNANATNLYSNATTFTASKPYNQDPDCWILGDATPGGWSNPPSAAQKMTYNRATKTFSISINLTAGNQVKFIGVSGQWGPMWAATTANFTPTSGSQFTLAKRPTPNDPDLNSIIAPSPTGMYDVVMDQTHLTCTITHQ